MIQNTNKIELVLIIIKKTGCFRSGFIWNYNNAAFIESTIHSNKNCFILFLKIQIFLFCHANLSSESINVASFN